MKYILITALLISSLFAGANETFAEATKAYHNGNYKKSMRLFMKIQTYYGPMTTIGLMHANGEGVKQDYEEALWWFKQAAKGDFAMAQNNLGNMYEKGQGIEQNKITAYQWYMKAAKQGNTNAQNNLDRLCKQSPWACK